MWRALFLAVGITLILLGGQLFFVEQIEVTRVRNPAAAVTGGGAPNGGSPFRQTSWQQTATPGQPPTFLYTPKDWMPWSLLAVGTVVVIYTFTLPGRRSSE